MKQRDEASLSLGQLAWQRLLRDPLAVIGLMIILIAVLIAILGGNIRPDPTPWANQQILGIRDQPPGSTFTFLQLPKESAEECSFTDQLFFGGCISRNELIPVFDGWFGNDTLTIVEVNGHNDLVEGAKQKFPIANLVLDLPDHFIDKKFLLGTDSFGRDVLSRLMAGTIISLSVGLIAVLISLVIGIPLGALAGYFRAEAPTFKLFGRTFRWPVDDVIMWLVNVIWSIPTLLLVIAITLALGKGFVQVFIAVGLTMWVEVARVVRGEVIRVREMEFVEAAKALGYTHGRIIFKHIMPNVMGPVIVISAANFATAILMEAGLSFLGIGAQLPMVSWGSMIRSYYPYITTDLPHLAILPGLCIMVLTLAFMLVGNGLRDALDTRSIMAR